MPHDVDKYWSDLYENSRDFRMISSGSLTTILEYVDTDLEKVALDIGCGTGQLTRELHHRGYECVGVDASQAAIRLARANTTRSGLYYMQCDIEHDAVDSLPLQPFSLITCKLVYAFIKDREQFLGRVCDLLAHQGTLVVITPVYYKEEDATPISVDFDTTSHELRGKFTNVTILEESGMVTFVCSRG